VINESINDVTRGERMYTYTSTFVGIDEKDGKIDNLKENSNTIDGEN